MGFIRLLLAISVIVSHCGPLPGTNLIEGDLAVQSFFIISGFYMSLILKEKYKLKDYRLFITNRFLKIYPLYWAVLFIFIISSLALAYHFESYHKYSPITVYDKYNINGSTLLFMIISNIVLFGQETMLYLGIDLSDASLYFSSNFSLENTTGLNAFIFIPQAWTISFELIFYLIAPFIVNRKIYIVLLLIVLSMLLRVLLYNNGFVDDPWSYRFFPTELMFFMLGILSFRLYDRFNLMRLPASFQQLTLLALVGLIVVYSRIPTIEIDNFPFSLKETIYFSFFCIAVPIIFNLSKRSRFDRTIGELSYPVYLVHMFVAVTCYTASKEWGIDSFFVTSTFIAIVSIVFSYVLYIAIMKPIEWYRQRRIDLKQSIKTHP